MNTTIQNIPKGGYDIGRTYQKGRRGENMNPMIWPVWVRVAVFMTILWTLVGSAAWYNNRDRSGNDEIIIIFLLPVVLFWGITWIVLGIINLKIRVRIIKILIAIPVAIVIVATLLFIFLWFLN
jgi:hypothetical protein